MPEGGGGGGGGGGVDRVVVVVLEGAIITGYGLCRHYRGVGHGRCTGRIEEEVCSPCRPASLCTDSPEG